jgi:ABC-type glycerol-3-phosphate transport system permease component
MGGIGLGSIKGRQVILWVTLLILLSLSIMPIIWAVFGSFKTTEEIILQPFSLPSNWSFDNIIRAWTEGNFQTYFLNSTFLTLVTMLVVFIAACPAGYALAKFPFKGRNFLFYFFLAGMTLPVQSIIIPLFFQMRNMGMIDTLLGTSLVLGAVALPFSIFLMRNTFKDIPDEIKESAEMDGASEWRIFIQIMLPLAKPGISAMLVFAFLAAWNDFLIPYLLLLSKDNLTIPIGLYYFQGQHTTNYALIYGATLISMIPSIIVYLILQRQFIEGMAAGSAK